MDLEKYLRIRPYLYHLTDQVNIDHIRKSNVLFSAAELMRRAGRTDSVRTRRPKHEPLGICGAKVSLRDQQPLHNGNIQLNGGFTFEDFVEFLNGRVFFWPGKESGPMRSGQNHFARYAREGPAVLRCEFRSLLTVNRSLEPLFCPYNSGAPRIVRGKKSPRGPNTFLKANDFLRNPSEVVEVTCIGTVTLPSDTELAQHPMGVWHRLVLS